MGTTPEEDRGAPEAPPEDMTATISGVRTEHQLRMQLRDAMKRNTTFERALRESAAFAYGRRDLADLRRLRAVLAAAGFPDPARMRDQEAPDSEPSRLADRETS
jgi:hypothetical protein